MFIIKCILHVCFCSLMASGSEMVVLVIYDEFLAESDIINIWKTLENKLEKRNGSLILLTVGQDCEPHIISSVIDKKNSNYFLKFLSTKLYFCYHSSKIWSYFFHLMIRIWSSDSYYGITLLFLDCPRLEFLNQKAENMLKKDPH